MATQINTDNKSFRIDVKKDEHRYGNNKFKYLEVFMKRKGMILPIVVLTFVLLVVAIPLLVKMVIQDTKSSVSVHKKSIAFNLAEAAVERGYWKVKSSTSTYETVRLGGALAGYRFDVIYDDISGGSYRIFVSSGPLADEVTIIGEGRDKDKKETRALRVVYLNTSAPGAIISGGVISESGIAIVHWGPILAMGNIVLSGTSASRYFPRKLSKQVVIPRDTNGLNPPNTDNLEWWSGYDVPELPIFDFTALRSSAAATGTLNCQSQSGSIKCCWISSCTYSGSPCTNCSVQNLYDDSRKLKNYVWYWDNNATWSGRNGIMGTVIVRGNLSISGGDYLDPPPVKVPANAWMEYQKIDTAATNQYPGDMGFHKSADTYDIGSCGNSCEGGYSGGDLGIYGFLYVGGDINIAGDSDIYGAVWVVGSWSGSGNVIVFYNDKLQLPTLNVVLVRQSWQEITPSSQPWN